MLVYTPTTGGVTSELGALLPQAPPTLPVSGNIVTYHIFLPATASGVVRWIQPYVQDNATSTTTHQFAGAFTADTMLIFGGWNTVRLTLPAGFVTPVYKIAVQIFTDGTAAFTGGIYVDAISW